MKDSYNDPPEDVQPTNIDGHLPITALMDVLNNTILYQACEEVMRRLAKRITEVGDVAWEFDFNALGQICIRTECFLTKPSCQ